MHFGVSMVSGILSLAHDKITEPYSLDM